MQGSLLTVVTSGERQTNSLERQNFIACIKEFEIKPFFFFLVMQSIYVSIALGKK